MTENSKSTQIGVRVPNGTMAKLLKYAEAERRSISAMVVLLIEDAIELRDRENGK